MLPEKTKKGLAAWRAYKKANTVGGVLWRDNSGIYFIPADDTLRQFKHMAFGKVFWWRKKTGYM